MPARSAATGALDQPIPSASSQEKAGSKFKKIAAFSGDRQQALGFAEIVFVSSSVGAIELSQEGVFRRFRRVSGSLRAYFQMRREIERRGFGGRPQEALERYRDWRKQYAGEPYEQQDLAWKASGGDARIAGRRGHIHDPFAALPLRDVRRNRGAGKSRMSAFRDGSAEIEGGCVCFVATADQKFIRIGFSPRAGRLGGVRTFAVSTWG